MSRFIITILIALSILECVRAATIFEALIEIKKIKSEVDTTLNLFQDYIENRLNEITEAQDGILNQFMDDLKKEMDPFYDELENGSVEEDNDEKIKCMREAKVKLDNLQIQSPKILQECIARQEKVDLDQLFNKLLDSASAGQILFRLIEGLEMEVKTRNYRNLNNLVEKKVPSIKVSTDRLKVFFDSLAKNADKEIEKAKYQFKYCSKQQVTDAHSSVVEIFNTCVSPV